MRIEFELIGYRAKFCFEKAQRQCFHIKRSDKIARLILGESDGHDSGIDSIESSFKNYIAKQQWRNEPGFQFSQRVFESLEQKESLWDIGCACGHLVEVLKSSANTSSWSYRGLDVHAACIDVARRAYPDLEFNVQDCGELLELGKAPSVVYSKGVLVSILQPEKALKAMLSIGAPQLILPHTALTACLEQGNSSSLFLECGETGANLYSVMNRAYFLEQVQIEGYQLYMEEQRGHAVKVSGLGYYHLYDLALRKV